MWVRVDRAQRYPSRSECERHQLVDAIEQAGLLEVGAAEIVGERAGELGFAIRAGDEAPDEPDAGLVQLAQAERAPLGCPDKFRGRQPAGACEIGDGVVRLVEESEDVHPPMDVVASVRARKPDVVSHGDRDFTTASYELVRDLDARCRGANDQDGSAQLVRPAIVQRVQLLHGGGYRRRYGRYGRCPVGAGGDDDRPGAYGSMVSLHRVAARCGSNTRHRGVGKHRCPERSTVPVNEGGQSGGAHVAVRVITVVAEPGEPGHPVGSEQTKRIPALVPPRRPRRRHARERRGRHPGSRGNGSSRDRPDRRR